MTDINECKSFRNPPGWFDRITMTGHPEPVEGSLPVTYEPINNREKGSRICEQGAVRLCCKIIFQRVLNKIRVAFHLQFLKDTCAECADGLGA